MKNILLLFVLLLFLTGCYNQRKANNKLQQAHARYPALVAGFTRAQFPCTTVRVDSTAYQASQQQADSLLAVLENWVIKTPVANAAIARPVYYPSIPLHQHAIFDQPVHQQLSDGLRSLRTVLREQPPLLKIVEDSAKIYLAVKAADDARDKEKYCNYLYETSRSELSAIKHKLRWAIIVPLWVLLVLAAAVLLYYRTKLLRLLN